jgi:hypothetical protein
VLEFLELIRETHGLERLKYRFQYRSEVANELGISKPTVLPKKA